MIDTQVIGTQNFRVPTLLGAASRDQIRPPQAGRITFQGQLRVSGTVTLRRRVPGTRREPNGREEPRNVRADPWDLEGE